MLHLRILYVGRRAQDPLLEAVTDYQRRLQKQARVELVRLRDAGKQAEAASILGRLQCQDWVIALDETGAQLGTLELTKRLGGWREKGRPVAMVIGGADGLDASVLARANDIIALSKMTLPHRLALALLTEQLYRAHMILQGSPYHRGSD